MANINRLSEKLNEIFKDKIELSFVSEYSIIIITKDDKCYIFKRNIKIYLIALSINEKKINDLINESFVEELSGKQIVDIKNGSDHSIARNIEGKVYCWGKNKHGVLGNGTDRPELNKFLINENVIDIKCGFSSTLVLTITGEVYTWGCNHNESLVQSTPFKLNSFNGEKVIAISCGSNHSLALTQSGQVYGWGKNDWGQLGISIGDYHPSPVLIEQDKHIKFNKISCGHNQSLLLSLNGDIYVCGWNANGDSNPRSQKKISSPIKLKLSEKFIDIASPYNHKFSVAKTNNSVFYIWGDIEDLVRSDPEMCQYTSFNDIFEHYIRETNNPIEAKIIQFNDDFIRNNKYDNEFSEIGSIGKGSFGEVFKVSEKNNRNMKFAIKKIKFEDSFEQQFTKELETSPIIHELNHENIVKYFEIWLENDFTFMNGIKYYSQNFMLYIQMELCGKSLKDTIDEIGKELNFCSNKTLTPLGYYIASEIFIEILEGVNYLHQNIPSIIHRDLNPWNIMLTVEEHIKCLVKIADLGLATIHESVNQSHTQDRGHSEFIAQENRDSKFYDNRADIYSVGVVLRRLFFIDDNRVYEIQNGRELETLLMNKYQKISDLCDKMTQTRINKRPVFINDILKEKHLWALNFNEFNLHEEFDNISPFYINHESFVYKLLEKKVKSVIPVKQLSMQLSTL